jgi:hypothetical protein
VSFDGVKQRNTAEGSDLKACPECRAQKGVPFSVESALPGRIVVSYRCDACRHEWQISRTLSP